MQAREGRKAIQGGLDSSDAHHQPELSPSPRPENNQPRPENNQQRPENNQPRPENNQPIPENNQLLDFYGNLF
jgi:hypothetical protein